MGVVGHLQRARMEPGWLTLGGGGGGRGGTAGMGARDDALAYAGRAIGMPRPRGRCHASAIGRMGCGVSLPGLPAAAPRWVRGGGSRPLPRRLTMSYTPSTRAAGAPAPSAAPGFRPGPTPAFRSASTSSPSSAASSPVPRTCRSRLSPRSWLRWSRPFASAASVFGRIIEDLTVGHAQQPRLRLLALRPSGGARSCRHPAAGWPGGGSRIRSCASAAPTRPIAWRLCASRRRAGAVRTRSRVPIRSLALSEGQR